ncbi:MAG: response regulator [Geminicoccaceae bacterium]
MVDDDRDFAESLAELLRLEGYAVAVAHDPAQALAAAAATVPAVALLDVRLGTGNGVDLLHALHARQPDLVAVMVTAYATLEASVEALKAGAYDYLRKPFLPEDLLATLSRCLERRRLHAERRQAVEDLARSEQRLRQVVENSPSAIALKDLAGSYLLANERFAAWFGRAPAQGEPEGMGDAAVAGHGRAITAEVDLDLPGTGTRHLLVTRFPVLDAAGQAVGIGTIGTDVTERHQAEERLRQAQRMEALGRLTGGVAHDFNNLLAVVLGNLRLIEEQCRARPDLLEMIEDALEATRSGVELTGRLLAFGRRQPLQPEVTDLREQVLSTARLLGRTLGERITIRLELAADPGLIHVDRSQLEAGLLNLALNARDAMPEGGELTLAVGEVELATAGTCADHAIAPGHYLALTVADTGHGMTAELLQRAVQPFFTTKAAGAGSGLGLSMVDGFVHQSGGHLRIASTPGRGTAVTLLFPLLARAAAPAGARPAPAALTPDAHGERILLVEDQPRVRQLLKRQLARLGYAVVEAADAAAALDRLAEARIDLLLTDIVLPGGIDGVRLAELALAHRPDLALVLTTGYAAPALTAGHGLPAAPILRKPFDQDELAKVLRQALAGRA